MGYQGMHIFLVALCCTNTLTRIHITAQATDRNCTCLPGCDFSKVCSPTPNCTRENVALGKPANMSSFWRSNEPSGPACLAVNGNTDTTYRPAISTESNPNCIHTGENDRNAYWLVDLGQNYTIRNITVYIRSGTSLRIALVIITVDGQSCYQFPNTPPSQLQYDVICNTTRRGSIVKFYKNGDNQPQYLLNICEVQVWVCTPGLYGINCDNKCNCKEDEICDNFDGTCTRVCRNGSYGTDCSNTCGSCRDSLPCNAYNGSCLNGCLDGFIGPLCKDICRNGTYGSNCTNKCGQCKNGNNCNASNGVCLNGCEDGYVLPLCKEICKNGTYGSNCTNKCGQCKNGNNCNASNGVCLNGCEEGYELTLCKEICRNGTYGSNCTNNCGQCKNGNNCNASNGVCLNGCEEGYELPLCKEICKNDTYGSNCTNKCGQCKNGNNCNASNGVCLNSCEEGYVLPLCKEMCRNGSYGSDCNNTCGSCRNGRPCNASNGVCLDGCLDGFMQPLCKDTCKNGTYGQYCSSGCGYCKDENICQASNGECLNGCKDGYISPLCQTSSQPDSVNSGAIAGGVVGAIIVLVIVAGIIILLRRRNIGKDSPTENLRSSIHSRTESDFTPASHTSVTTGQNSSQKPKAAVKPTIMKTVKGNAEGSVYQNVVLGASNYVLGASNVLYNNQYSDNNISSTQETTVSEEDILFEDNAAIYGNDETIYAALKESSQVLDRVQSYLVDKLTCGELIEEFKKSGKDLRKPHAAALSPINLKKNRFAVIVPYDCNRVILKDNYDKDGATDFINASFMKGFQSDVQYIAAQGPRDNTVTDFWRMIWQERVTHIVMVTSAQEGGKSKCYEYWPAKDTTQIYGPVKVYGLDVQSRACFFIRTFVVSCDNGGEYEVTQYHFTAWPDHGVPTVTSLVDYWRFVKSRVERDSLSPLLVHCSAGVGRTGTYIGLDIGMDACLQEGEINILELVDHMRDDRTLMVQTPEQYVFLYKALLEAYTGRGTKLSIDQFDATFSQSIKASSPHPRIDKEFKTIMQMRSLIADQSHTNAIAEENISKNRNESVLPSDNHIVYLTEHVPGRNQYINAVYMSTYTNSRGCILTQLPLKNTLIDFWRMVDGTGATTVVSIGSPHEERNVKEFCRYWPESKNPIMTGPYSVNLKLSSSLGKDLTRDSILLTKQGSAMSREIQMLRYVGWDKEIPDMSDVLQLVDILDTASTNTGSNPVVIQCIDGGAKCGLFCAIRDIISRVTYDREVDVYMTVRQVQSVRPDAVTTVEQYRFCYEVAQVKVRELSVYANA